MFERRFLYNTSHLAHLLWEQGVPGSNPGTPTTDLVMMDAGGRDILSLERAEDGKFVKADIFDRDVYKRQGYGVTFKENLT